jgi:hypothetical protein
VQPPFRGLFWSTGGKSEQQQALTKPKPKYSFSRIDYDVYLYIFYRQWLLEIAYSRFLKADSNHM